MDLIPKCYQIDYSKFWLPFLMVQDQMLKQVQHDRHGVLFYSISLMLLPSNNSIRCHAELVSASAVSIQCNLLPLGGGWICAIDLLLKQAKEKIYSFLFIIEQ